MDRVITRWPRSRGGDSVADVTRVARGFVKCPQWMAAALWLANGCAGSGATHARANEARVNSAARVVLVPQLGRLAWVGEESGTRRYLFGSLRVEITARGVEVSRMRFGTPIAAATQTARGWVFVAQDGVVAASDTFVGDLRRLGQTAVFAPPGARWSRGRAVIADASGVLLTTDGASPLASMPGLSGRLVDSAVFVDAEHGAAVTRDGALLFTQNGGGAWRALQLAGAVPVAVDRADEALLVVTSTGTTRLDANGAISDAAATPAVHRPATGDAARAFDAVLLAYPDLLPNLEAVTRTDGVAVLVDRDVLVELDRDTGRVRRRVRGLPLGASRLAAWGTDVAIVEEPTGEEEPHAFRLHEDDAVPIELPANARGAVFSDDGLHAVRLRACRGDSAHGPSVCLLEDGRSQWRTVSVGRPLDRIVAMRGTRALAHVDHGAFVIVDFARGATVESRVLVGDGGAIEPVALGFTADGAVAGSGVDGDGTRYALVGASIDALRPMPLPSGALVSGFADRRRGVAAGRTAARLWRTIDGGEHWEHLDVGIDGEASLVPLLSDPRAVYGAIDCDAARCQIGRAASVSGWGAVTPAAATILGPHAASESPDAS